MSNREVVPSRAKLEKTIKIVAFGVDSGYNIATFKVLFPKEEIVSYQKSQKTRENDDESATNSYLSGGNFGCINFIYLCFCRDLWRGNWNRN